MTIEDAVYQLLSANMGITALVSGRIFSGVLKQELRDYPAIVYRATSRDVVRILEGSCALVAQRIAVFSVSRSDAGQAIRLDNAVAACLDEYRGTVSDGLSPESTIDIQGVFSTVAHEYQYDDPTKTHQVLTEFEFHYLDPMRL